MQTFYTAVYLSSDPQINASDICVQSESRPGLAAGGQTTLSTSFYIPLWLVPGSNYYWGAIVDSDSRVPETNETNNAAVGNLTVVDVLPDLQVCSVTGPAMISPGLIFPYSRAGFRGSRT
jgi:hypothetical protein